MNLTSKFEDWRDEAQLRIYRCRDWFRPPVNFLRNVWRFRKELKDFQPWDYNYNIDLFARSIEITADLVERSGMEVLETRQPKVEKMRRFIWLARNFDRGLDLAQQQLGPVDWGDITGSKDLEKWFAKEDPHRWAVYDRSEELEKEMWDEMWRIIRGTETEEYTSVSRRKTYKYSNDGTDMRNWWD